MANFDPNNPAELAAALEILNAPLGNATNFDEFQAAMTARLDQLGLVNFPLTDPKETGAFFGSYTVSEGYLKDLASPERQDQIKTILEEAATNPEINPTSEVVQITELTDEESAALFAEAESGAANVSPTEETTPLTEEEVAALFAEAETESITISPSEESVPLTDEDAAALFAEAEIEAAIISPTVESTPLTDEEAEALFAEAETEPATIDEEEYTIPEDDGLLEYEPATIDEEDFTIPEEDGLIEFDPPPTEEEDYALPEGADRIENEEPATIDEEDLPQGEDRIENPDQDPNAGLVVSGTEDAQKKATNQDQANFQQAADWRVRLSLAPNAKYLYNAENAGILAPLQATNGVIFPYSPQIQLSYNANYTPSDLTHVNYKFYQYQNSEVGQITITAEFTAQDTEEANYLLAVIHFFRSVTKMFYGQDNNPPNGVPPPLCYLSGYGPYQFDNHPLVISNFSYTLPNEVDYIRAGATTQLAGVNLQAYQHKVNTYVPSLLRLFSSGLKPGGQQAEPKFNTLSNKEATYVPTKLSISLTCLPVATRRDVSNRFSLGKYATGELMRGSRNQGGGIW